MKFSISNFLLSSIVLTASMSVNAQSTCALPANVYMFTYNGTVYEIVRENRTWTDAAACAVEHNGYLAEINDSSEQAVIFAELGNASIVNSNTVAPDGGGASYVWIGGNDLGTEGEWTWDGDNNGSGSQFWQGTASGSPVGGLYNNWGNEPDDFGTGQDGLGLAITNWPLGSAGQWNDVDDANTLYFVIEYPSTAGVNNQSIKNIEIFPIPSTQEVTINAEIGINSILVYTLKGEKVETIEIASESSYSLDISNYKTGTYFLKIGLENGTFQTHKIVR